MRAQIYIDIDTGIYGDRRYCDWTVCSAQMHNREWQKVPPKILLSSFLGNRISERNFACLFSHIQCTYRLLVLGAYVICLGVTKIHY